ncbi:phosphatidylethanolamine-binding protein [Diplodia corticola]|uniref:Phosphatidylethanolamine-binding protein n=1 Tax=Diplodia corticola TaxID=236234 RepID=A0A1J9RX50_9PEZI|nr:phosphatidylethanolamine-binding protein [Diplodia corticola]OJD32919.1 phosphatidylethanolamine-binding protein [Diplodia corticola]
MRLSANPASTSSFVSLLLGFVLLQWLLLRVGALVAPAGQHVLNNAAAAPKSILGVRAELIKAEIIPTVIDDFLPSLTVNITWPSDETADLGNTIKPKRLKAAPSIYLDDEPTSASAVNPCKSNMTYVLAMTDPDAPSRDNPEWAEFCHWIVAGVPLTWSDAPCADSISANGHQTGLKEVMEYYPPGPPPKTWKHRYVFIVFAPSNSTSQPLDLTKPKDRKNWGTGKERHGVKQWANENGLTPVAANFVYSKNKKQ